MVACSSWWLYRDAIKRFFTLWRSGRAETHLLEQVSGWNSVNSKNGNPDFFFFYCAVTQWTAWSIFPGKCRKLRVLVTDFKTFVKVMRERKYSTPAHQQSDNNRSYWSFFNPWRFWWADQHRGFILSLISEVEILQVSGKINGSWWRLPQGKRRPADITHLSPCFLSEMETTLCARHSLAFSE